MTPSSIDQAIQVNRTGLRNAASQGTEGGKQLGKQDFLNLLMTQMANQDPLDPMNAENMMQQLAAMGTVEQLQNLNEKTAQLMALQQHVARASVGNLLGKDVEIGSQSISLQQGEALPVSYRLSGDADRVQVFVHDSSGNAVRRFNLNSRGQGSHEFHWDGRDEDGDLLPDGTYQYNVFAKTDGGEDISVSYSKSGQVGMIKFKGANPLVKINGEWLPVQDILGIDDSSSRRFGNAVPLPMRTELNARRPELNPEPRIDLIRTD